MADTFPIRRPVRRGRGFLLLAVLFFLLIASRTIAGFVIEYSWWSEVGHLPTYYNLLLYAIGPVAVITTLMFVVLWVVHARALKHAGTGLGEHPLYARATTLALLVFAFLFSSAFIDSHTIIRYLGGRQLPVGDAFRDPVFGQPLGFYLFHLPFYELVLGFALGATIVTALLYWLTTRVWSLQRQFGSRADRGPLDVRDLQLHLAFESGLIRILGVVALLSLAVRFFLSRYEMVFHDHGFMVGIDYVDEHVGLPLVWLSVAMCVFAAVLLGIGRWRAALACLVLLIFPRVLPPLVNSIYVKPNEISLQRDYIVRHIESTRAAYGLQQRIKESEFDARIDAKIDVDQHRPLLDNVRLWDWRAFHDTVTQIQALRTYYSFADTDVDRYIIDGQLRQMLVTPRELDVAQLPDARTRWINPHFIYTHGYGMVMAEANRITADGLPYMLIQDAPPKISNAGLKLTRPELYYAERSHEPVFVHTAQQEFNYPSGSDNVHNTYDGKGGFPISSLPMRMAAALYEGDINILLTGYLTGQSRMMIHRQVRDRVENLADFVHWDNDPYLVLMGDGRLTWIIDGYTSSSSHPYARRTRTEQLGTFNYVRNSVKATVDAYDGTVHLYNFDATDPIIRAHMQLFPNLIEPAANMPAELRSHTRYPEVVFRAQAEMYRTYHMRDPAAFYNREDLWDVATGVVGQDRSSAPLDPTYIVATLPGETKPEFLLMLPFTPHNKLNLVGVMAARCDAEHLGELVVLQLSKQALVFGPMQIDARIDQDSTISQNLSLWNTQGSQVIRGRMLVLPIDQTFLYVEPLYIRSSQASMPQLKKIVLAAGNSLIYTDTYEEALAQLRTLSSGVTTSGQTTQTDQPVTSGVTQTTSTPSGTADQRLDAIRTHLRRYRELSAQGKWAEAGRELEAVESIASSLKEAQRSGSR